ncbi:MAG: ABC transporter permease, partial [Candidatus Omnitrophica bacterium]|nr:ABC transporter permease [Candidatus Omnitrophota bacterium]
MLKELFLAKRYLLRGKSRHVSFIGLISCFGVAVGVATLIAVISVMNGFDKDLMDRLLEFNDHIVVETVVPEYLDTVKDKLSEWDDVVSVSKVLQTQVFGNFQDRIYPLIVKGIDFDNDIEWTNFSKHIVRDNKNAGIFIGQGVADRFFVKDKLEYYPLQKRLHIEEFPLRGIFKVGLVEIDSNYIIGDIDDIMPLSPNYILYLGVRLDDPLKAAQIKKRIVGSMGSGVFVTTWIESNSVLFSALQLEKYVMFIILSLIVFVACFNIFATLTVKVVEKTKAIGVL